MKTFKIKETLLSVLKLCVSGAVIGLVGLFCCCANAPISSVLLGIEMFGFQSAPYYILVCALLFPLSVKKGLFIDRRFNPAILWKKQKS